MYWDATTGLALPTSRTNGQIDGSIRDENLHERVMGGHQNGGQFDSFFAVFGPRNAQDGTPVPLFDKLSGEIDSNVAKEYAEYDIVRILKGSDILETDLRDKLHVICGTEDNYYLDRACRSLGELLNTHTSHGNYMKFVPGDHSTIKTKRFYQHIFEEIAQRFSGSIETW